jgi:hypothetical protein
MGRSVSLVIRPSTSYSMELSPENAGSHYIDQIIAFWCHRWCSVEDSFESCTESEQAEAFRQHRQWSTKPGVNAPSRLLGLTSSHWQFSLAKLLAVYEFNVETTSDCSKGANNSPNKLVDGFQARSSQLEQHLGHNLCCTA